MKTRFFLVVMIGGIAFFLTACINLGTGRSPVTKLYMLETGLSEPAVPETAQLPAGFTIGVGPIKMPQYLSMPMIVTRTGPNEVQSDEFHQWAEPLPENIARVMSADLMALTGAAHSFSFPWRSAIPIDVQAAVNVMQFDVSPDGGVTLKAQWSLLGEKGKQVQLTRRSVVTRQVQGSGYADRVAGMSQALGDLTREIATAITEQASRKPAADQ
jgi:uncharacterized lipoprotein YmbA